MLTKTRTSLAVLIASLGFAGAAIAPTVSQADPAGNGGTESGCGNDTKPGDIQEVKVTITINGKVTEKETQKYVCGKDGNWHRVVDNELPPTGTKPVKSAPIVSKVLR